MEHFMLNESKSLVGQILILEPGPRWSISQFRKRDSSVTKNAPSRVTQLNWFWWMSIISPTMGVIGSHGNLTGIELTNTKAAESATRWSGVVDTETDERFHQPAGSTAGMAIIFQGMEVNMATTAILLIRCTTLWFRVSHLVYLF